MNIHGKKKKPLNEQIQIVRNNFAFMELPAVAKYY
jgi:hypothetical protein